MSKRLEAIYENGVLRLLEPVDLREHQQVTVILDENGTSVTCEAGDDQQEPPMPTHGAELVAWWEKKGVIGTHPEITDGAAYARTLRRQAETRQG